MNKPVLAVTPGEPAGIGPEILLRLLAEHPEFRVLAVADPELMRLGGARLGLDIPVIEWSEGRPSQRANWPVFPFPCAARLNPAGSIRITRGTYSGLCKRRFDWSAQALHLHW